MILNAEQILEALKKELSFQNHDCRIDIVTKRPEEIITGFEHILKELEKIQITLETKKIEVKGIIHFPNLTKNLAPIVLHTLKFNTIFKTTFITIPPTKSIFEYKFC